MCSSLIFSYFLGAEVRLGRWRGCKVAVKVLYENIRSGFNSRLFQQEVNVGSRLRHPNIVTMFGVTVTDRTPSQIIMELLECSLSELLTTASSSDGLTLREKVDLGSDCISGVSYLHRMRPHPFLHGDIRSTNVLITALLTAKIGDFGTARLASSSLSAGIVSADYLAPERMMGGHNTKEADVFSLGLTLTELFTGQRIARSAMVHQIRSIQPILLQRVCERMTKENPSERLTGSQSLKDVETLRQDGDGDYVTCPLRRSIKRQHSGPVFV